MEHESVLERRLNGDEDPTDLPLALLKHITNDFSEERKIGQGGFAAVYKGVLRNGTIVAVKRIDVNVYTLDGKSFRREFNSLMFTNHENVVRFLGFCSNTHQTWIKESETGKNYLVNVNERMLCLEYISNGSLSKHITDELRGLSWETRYKIIIGICNGLSYLHKEKIIHMDLKPGNILLDDYMVPKITDFGLSRPDENSRTAGECFGTLGYMAPEYEKDGETSFKCDIYSLGVIIIELLTGYTGVPNKHNVLRRWRHRWGKPATLLQIQQVTRCIEISFCCKQQEPRDRPSIGDIIRFLMKSESTDEHTDPKNPHLDKDDMLGIEPLELRIPYELKEEISCFTVYLTNNTSSFFAFNIQLSSKHQYIAQPDKGIVQPDSKYGVKITIHARDVQEHGHTDKFIVQSMKLRDDQLRESMFSEGAGEFVDDVYLMVVYEPSRKRKLGSLLWERARFSRHYRANTTYLVQESDRVVDVTRGVMGSLLDKLGKLIKDDYNLEKTMKRDIEYFSQELAKIQLDLPKLEKLDGVKVWVDEIMDLSYRIDDMVDDFLVHVEPQSNRSALTDLLHEGINLLENGNNQVGDVIRDIKNKDQVVVTMGNKYTLGFKDDVSNITPKGIIDIGTSARYKHKDQLISIKMLRDEIIRRFDEDVDEAKQWLNILSIIGMGGLGKTTLAKAVYDKLRPQYNLTAFVTVGQSANLKILLKNILTECRMDASNFEHLGVPQLINQLQGLLTSKRYFIVIDDIWDSEVWDAINYAFPRNNPGSRMITTTRILDVGRACCGASGNIYAMKPLSDEDSRRLFFSRIFGPEEICPDDLKEISTDILERCGGMPLAINSIASLLACDPQKSTWDYVRKNWSVVIEGNAFEHMKQILDLSYMHLPDHLKTCLLHVGMYQDRDIDKDDLLRQWVAEGFVHVSINGGLDAEEIADNYFTELMSMCIFQQGRWDNERGKVLSCRVHPIFLDFMRAKAAEHNFIHLIDGSKYERGEIHRVSVHCNGKEDERILDTIKEGSLSHVRSLLLYRSSLVPYFLEFKFVRVLHLEHKAPFIGGLDLTGISRLFLLRYLKVTSDESGYELRLPNQIAELQQLETIDVHNASLKKFPSDIVSLPWLTHLSSTGNAVLPDGIEGLKSLWTLVGVDVVESSVQNIMGISELTNLKKLMFCSKGIVQPTTMRMNALHHSISMLSASLKILSFGEKWNTKLDVLGWSSRTLFPGGSYIRELDLGGCEFESCPEWIGQLHDLYKLRIMVREVADGFSILEGLSSLAYFHLIILNQISEQKEESVVIHGGGAFKALKHLIFYCPMASLTFEVGAMPSLENLNIAFRYHMARRFLPVGVEHLPTGTLNEIWLCVLPNAGRVEDFPLVITQQRTFVRGLLKGAFKPHHPAAQIVFVFGCDLPVLIDQEDCDNEESSCPIM